MPARTCVVACGQYRFMIDIIHKWLRMRNKSMASGVSNSTIEGAHSNENMLIDCLRYWVERSAIPGNITD